METTMQNLTERRRMLGRLVNSTVSKNGPLSPSERSTLSRLTKELDSLESEIRSDAEREHGAAFRSWLRYGLTPSPLSKGISHEERSLLQARDVSGGGGLQSGGQGAFPGSTAGFFAPVEFNERVISSLKLYSDLTSVATIQETSSGAPRAFPIDSDSSIAGEMIAEAVTQSEDTVPLDQKILGAYKFSSRIVTISMELAMDTGFDLAGYLADRFAIRLARAMNPLFTTGSGSAQPMGFVTAASVGVAATGSSSNTGGSEGGGVSIGSDDLLSLESSVDGAYRTADGSTGYMMHPDTWTMIRKVKDRNGRPLYSLNEDSRALNGWPVFFNADMDKVPTLASSPVVTKKTIAFGKFSRFTIRTVRMMVVRFDERFADFAQVGYLALMRADGNLLDAGAIRLLTNTF